MRYEEKISSSVQKADNGASEQPKGRDTEGRESSIFKVESSQEIVPTQGGEITRRTRGLQTRIRCQEVCQEEPELVVGIDVGDWGGWLGSGHSGHCGGGVCHEFRR